MGVAQSAMEVSIHYYSSPMEKSPVFPTEKIDIDSMAIQKVINLKLQLEEFYKNCRHTLYQYAMSLCSNSEEAQDLVHIGFEKLIERVIERGEIPEHTASFVYQCMRNYVIDTVRRQKMRDDIEFDLGHITRRANLTEEQDLLVRLFRRLSQDQREVIMLKEVMGYTFKEISRIREMPLSTITTWYSRGMKKLRKGFPEVTK